MDLVTLHIRAWRNALMVPRWSFALMEYQLWNGSRVGRRAKPIGITASLLRG